MVVRLSTKTEFVIELLRDGRLVDCITCSGPADCARCACVLIARVGVLEQGDIVLVRDFDG